jgi:DNA-binding NtrC family response regulator
MKTDERILIVDDDAEITAAVTGLLGRRGYRVVSAETGAAALDAVRNETIGLVLLDVRLGAEDGLDLLPPLKALRPEMSVIILTGKGTVDNAFEALRRGADYYVEKPIQPPSFLTIVEKGLEAHRLRRRNVQLERLRPSSEDVVYSPGGAMSRAIELAEAVAGRDTTVLLRGETGTGKGLLARRIHDISPRRKEPFVQLNCAGLQRELTESELFGHEPGAFTDARKRKIGLFEAAHGGTLFLDEIGEMEAGIQAKLLNALEQKRFRRLGGIAEIEVDARLIAATNRDLTKGVAEGRFREDLLYRLNVFAIDLPPLRERPEDILLLARCFLREFYGAQSPALSPAAIEALLAYRWPGNARELRNVIERASILCPPEAEILPRHLGSLAAENDQLDELHADGPSLISVVKEQAERQLIETVLKRNDRNVTASAKELNISRETLYQKIKKYHLTPEE